MENFGEEIQNLGLTGFVYELPKYSLDKCIEHGLSELCIELQTLGV
jgi:hypothetical protein